MKCKAVRRWLRENLPATLEQAPPAVRHHTTACVECHAAWQRLTAALEPLATLPAPAAPVDLRRRVMTALPSRQPARRRLFSAVPAAALAILALVVIGRVQQPTVIPLPPGEMNAQTYVQQHTLAIASDPLADATALHAIGTLSLRADMEHGVH